MFIDTGCMHPSCDSPLQAGTEIYEIRCGGEHEYYYHIKCWEKWIVYSKRSGRGSIPSTGQWCFCPVRKCGFKVMVEPKKLVYKQGKREETTNADSKEKKNKIWKENPNAEKDNKRKTEKKIPKVQETVKRKRKTTKLEEVKPVEEPKMVAVLEPVTQIEPLTTPLNLHELIIQEAEHSDKNSIVPCANDPSIQLSLDLKPKFSIAIEPPKQSEFYRPLEQFQLWNQFAFETIFVK